MTTLEAFLLTEEGRVFPATTAVYGVEVENVRVVAERLLVDVARVSKLEPVRRRARPARAAAGGVVDLEEEGPESEPEQESDVEVLAANDGNGASDIGSDNSDALSLMPSSESEANPEAPVQVADDGAAAGAPLPHVDLPIWPFFLFLLLFCSSVSPCHVSSLSLSLSLSHSLGSN